MTSIDSFSARRFQLRKFVVDGGGKLLVLGAAVLIFWALVSSLIDRPDRYLPSPGTTAATSLDLLYKGALPSSRSPASRSCQSS